MKFLSNDVMVMGGGHVGFAVAAFLSSQGVNVHMFSRRFLPISKTLTIKAIGQVLCGNYQIASFSAQMQAISAQLGRLPSTVIICCRGNDLVEYARIISRHVYSEMNIVLFCGSRLDDWVFRQQLLSSGVLESKMPAVASATSSPFCCCLQSDTTVEIKAKKGQVCISAQTPTMTERIFNTLQAWFSNLKIAGSSLEVALEKRNDITHIPLMLTSARTLEKGESHLFYHEVGPRSVNLIVALDNERLKIGQAYGLKLDDWMSWHQAEYHTSGLSIYENLQQTSAYQHSFMDTIDDRYLTEDVPYGAVPLQSLARIAGVQTPVLDGCIALVSQLIDMPVPAWTAELLGIARLTPTQILELLSSSWVKQPLYLPPPSLLSPLAQSTLQSDKEIENVKI
ncbi:MAG: NAD/NADP octopine/nopaline dehydrogenase family protein [Microcoleus sp.]|uniref:NAD/NADP octopine/nopaline dehydrogenase family protein n=1 Tax=Microcoleus sp. CAWBG640 TaxID=2841653 RepID=UPI00312B4FAA